MSENNSNVPSNPNYVVEIRRDSPKIDGEPVVIRAGLPETFSFGVDASYEPRLPNTLDAVVGGRAGQLLRASDIFFKTNRVFQEFSHQVWTSTSPIEFSLPLLFDAKDDARTDVLDPIRKLIMMTLPYNKSEGDRLLLAPGPNLATPDEGRISVRIGNFFYVHSVLLVNVNPTFDSKFNKDGVPISATCDLSLRTVNTPVQSDLNKFFLQSPNGALFTDYGVGKLTQQVIEGTQSIYDSQTPDAGTGTPDDSPDASGAH